MQGAAVESGGWSGREIAGRYQVQRMVARGGMAVVYEATDRQLLRRVALKVLIPPPVEGGDFQQRFRQEAQALASLQHPNIVTIHDYGSTEDDRWFLAMEYVDGPRLSDLLREGPLPMERALGLLHQVCLALRYAHRKGIVHRDLKPSNLLIHRADDGAEVVKVVDFGLVKTQDSDKQLSESGLVMGSPHFMAPEQVLSQATDARTDIYALGILLFRCLTGHFPFHGASATATMLAHVHHPIPTFSAVAADLALPPGLEAITRRCLAKNPDDRYPSMQALLEALSPWCRSDSFGTSSMLQPIKLAATPTPTRNWVLPGIAALVVGGLIAALGVSWAISALNQGATEGETIEVGVGVGEVPATPAPLTVEVPPATAEAGTTDARTAVGKATAAGTTAGAEKKAENRSTTATEKAAAEKAAAEKAAAEKAATEKAAAEKAAAEKKAAEKKSEKLPEGYMPVPF